MRDANMDKVLTDYPFVDIMIYYTKILGMGCIVKSEQDANNAEDKTNAYDADLYIQSIEGTADFRLYDYNEHILRKAGVPQEYIKPALKTPSVIPNKYRETCRKMMAEYYIKHYVEKNNYYRKIAGLPDFGIDGIHVPDDLVIENIGVNYEQTLDQMSNTEIDILKEKGIWKQILERYNGPRYEYLRYIQSGIDFYKARKAENFQLLWLPSIDNTIITDKFKHRFAVNRQYAINAIYSEAYKFDSSYYEAFVTIFIIIQTMTDMLAELQDHIIRLDVFDERCIKAIFESHGIPYYSEIPLVYQVRMMKNINTLLKYKSTSKCMFEICSLFGFENIKIFKYYLLRDRLTDPDTDEYVFNYKSRTVLDTEDVVDISSKEVKGFSLNNIPIPFPSDGFLEKGGVVHIIVDGKRVDNDKYEIVGDKLIFNDTNFLKNKTKIEFRFYSNANFNDDISQLNKYCIKTIVKHVPITSDTQTKFTIEIPKTNYFTSGGSIILSVGSTFIEPTRYTIDEATKTVTFKESQSWFSNSSARDLMVIYVYGNSDYPLISKLTSYTYNGPAKATSSFNIPLPKEDYLKLGGEYFTTMGSVFLSKDRYFLNNTNLSFISGDDKLDAGRNANFYSFYTTGTPVEMVEKWFDFKVDEVGKTLYEVTLPFENYAEQGHIHELYINGVKVKASEYDFVKNNIKILDQAKTMRINTPFRLHFVYPKYLDNTQMVVKEVNPKDKSDRFKVPYPYEQFPLFKTDKMILQVNGRIVPESAYVITDNTLIIRDPENFFTKADIVYCKFYMYEDNKYTIHVFEDDIKVRNQNQKKFTINFPFFNYLESGNGFIIMVGGTIISDDRYNINGNILTFDDSVELDKNRIIKVIFIYNSVYDTFNNYIRTDFSLYNLRSGNKIVDIPYPFDNYLESSNNNQMDILCEDGTILTNGQDYEVFDDQVAFTNVDEVLKHGDNIIFSFNYVNAKKKIVYDEDNTKNYTLKFVKMPLDESADKYLKNETQHINYEGFTEGDWLWNNDYDHDYIRNLILEKEFAYVRTKYLSIDTVMSMSKLAFDIPYFFNVFFDNHKFEERMRLQVPNIRNDKTFKLSYILCYLFAIAHEYYGVKDTVQKETVPIMYILGFNFKTDLELLRQDIEKIGIVMDEKMGNVKDWQTYHQQISIKGLINIFNNNKSVYETVMRGMYRADNKRIYDAYKMAYKALMIRKYTDKFFVKDGVHVADTITEFLSYADKDLYNAIIRIRSFTEESQKRKEIVNSIMDTVKYIEIYMNDPQFKLLFNDLPGVGLDFIKMYLKKIIDFFKSYKVEIAGINTVYKFDDKYRQYIKPIDMIHYISKLRQEDFPVFFDDINRMMDEFLIDEVYSPQEIVRIMTYWFKHVIYKDVGLNQKLKDPKNLPYMDKLHKTITRGKWKEDLRNDLIKKEIMKYVCKLVNREFMVNDIVDFNIPTSIIIPKDRFDVIENVYLYYTGGGTERRTLSIYDKDGVLIDPSLLLDIPYYRYCENDPEGFCIIDRKEPKEKILKDEFNSYSSQLKRKLIDETYKGIQLRTMIFNPGPSITQKPDSYNYSGQYTFYQKIINELSHWNFKYIDEFVKSKDFQQDLQYLREHVKKHNGLQVGRIFDSQDTVDQHTEFINRYNLSDVMTVKFEKRT